mgnify:CR=1 FL=1
MLLFVVIYCYSIVILSMLEYSQREKKWSAEMGRMKKVSLLLVMAGLLLMWTGECRAWTPPKEENEADFLKWYEENKDTDGAVFTLSGDLYIRSGSGDEPVILDGNGDITIDCGTYGFIVDGAVQMDNPGLTVQGEKFFLIMVRSDGHLTLEQGTIRYTGSDGVLVQVINGTLTVPGSGSRFQIIGEGNNLTGIAYSSFGEAVISNMDLTLSGGGISKGIATDRLSSLTLDNCEITVTAGTEGYGLYSGTFSDFMIRDSRVSAFCSDVSGSAGSAYTSEGEIRWENSELEPEPAKGRTYSILETGQMQPVYIEAADPPSEWPMPDSMPVFVKETGETGEKVLDIPVIWDLPERAFTEPGYCIVKGRFTDETLDGILINPDDVTPEMTVLCVPPEKMFLIAYEAIEIFGKSGLRLFVPYPAGADRMIIEYSTDGTKFFTYSNLTGSNIIEGTTMTKNGLLSFYLDIPAKDNILYLRTVVEGESVFSGTSAVWKIGEGKNEGLPPDAEDDNDGDRGGQDSENPFPEDGEESSGGESSGDAGTDMGNPGEDHESEAGTSGEKTDSEKVIEESGSRQLEESNKSAERAAYSAADTKQPSGSEQSESETLKKSGSGNPAQDGSAKSGQYVSASDPAITEETNENGIPPQEKQEKNSKSSLSFVLIFVCLAAVIMTGAWCGYKVFSHKE